jgi:toxin YoeB
MEVAFSKVAWDQYLYWQSTDKKIATRVNQLIKDIARNPFEGLGKPEPLKFSLAGYWTRRINIEHRIVYKIEDGVLSIIQCRYHY